MDKQMSWEKSIIFVEILDLCSYWLKALKDKLIVNPNMTWRET